MEPFKHIITVSTGEEKALRFNMDKLRWSLMHYKSMEPMIRALEYGSKKYGDWNWTKGQGLNPKEILECGQRHLAKMMDGERFDPESGVPHIGHYLANGMFYSFFTEVDKEK